MASSVIVWIVLLVIVFVALIIIIPAAIASWRSSSRGPSRREKELEAALEEFRELAYQFRETDTSLSYEIIDKVKQLKGEKRELR